MSNLSSHAERELRLAGLFDLCMTEAGSDSTFGTDFNRHRKCAVFERDQSIEHIQGLKRPSRKHRARLQHLEAERDTIQSAIDRCLR